MQHTAQSLLFSENCRLLWMTAITQQPCSPSRTPPSWFMFNLVYATIEWMPVTFNKCQRCKNECKNPYHNITSSYETFPTSQTHHQGFFVIFPFFLLRVAIIWLLHHMSVRQICCKLNGEWYPIFCSMFNNILRKYINSSSTFYYYKVLTI